MSWEDHRHTGHALGGECVQGPMCAGPCVCRVWFPAPREGKNKLLEIGSSPADSGAGKGIKSIIGVLDAGAAHSQQEPGTVLDIPTPIQKDACSRARGRRRQLLCVKPCALQGLIDPPSSDSESPPRGGLPGDVSPSLLTYLNFLFCVF